jgi:hypothetical protein
MRGKMLTTTVIKKKENLRALLKLHFIHYQNVSDDEINMLIRCGNFEADKYQELSTFLRVVSNGMAKDAFKNFFFPYTYALCHYYMEEKNQDILGLNAKQQLPIVAGFISADPAYLLKALWKKADTAIDFDSIFAHGPHKEKVTSDLLGKFAQLFKMKLVWGFRYALNEFATKEAAKDGVKKRGRKAYIDGFKGFMDLIGSKNAMPPLEDMPVVKTIPKMAPKENKVFVEDEDLNEWLAANMLNF